MIILDDVVLRVLVFAQKRNAVFCASVNPARIRRGRMKRRTRKKKRTLTPKDIQRKYNRKSSELFLREQGSHLPHGKWYPEEDLLVLVLMRLASRYSLSDFQLTDIFNLFRTYNDKCNDSIPLRIREKDGNFMKSKLRKIREIEKLNDYVP